MRDSVLDVFPSWSARFEGNAIPWPYLDVKGLCTIGTGQLCDPMSLMAGIVFVRIDGSRATLPEVATMWMRTKGERLRLVDVAVGQVLATRLGGGHRHWQRLTSLRATPESLAADLRVRLLAFERLVRAAFPAWESWPAQAQLATLGMAWAAGPACFARFPRFSEAARRQDWATCSVECRLDETGNPGLKPRNAAQRALFVEAGASPALDPAMDPRLALVGAAAPSLVGPQPGEGEDPDPAA